MDTYLEITLTPDGENLLNKLLPTIFPRPLADNGRPPVALVGEGGQGGALRIGKPRRYRNVPIEEI